SPDMPEQSAEDRRRNGPRKEPLPLLWLVYPILSPRRLLPGRTTYLPLAKRPISGGVGASRARRRGGRAGAVRNEGEIPYRRGGRRRRTGDARRRPRCSACRGSASSAEPARGLPGPPSPVASARDDRLR